MRLTGLTIMYFTLNQSSLGHILKMGNERIPKSILYSELVDDRRKRGRPILPFKNVCNRYTKSLNVGNIKWEELANDHDKWRSIVLISLRQRKRNSIKDLSRRQIQTRMSLLLFFCIIAFVSF